jgi:ribose transport system ATP-binding protein
MIYPVLKLENISKRVSDFFILKNISLELYKGEVHVLIGENGSGKSCLMNIIWGAFSKDQGDIIIDGIPVNINSPMDAKKLGIAMIHQDSSLFEHFSVAENIFIDNKPYSNKTLKIIDFGKMHSDCQRLFEKLGFSLSCKAVVKSLSVAQKQLVEIAKAYISNARFIIMDEPTSSLTDSECALLFNIINELKKAGVSILYISHRLEEIMQIGDRISIMRDGEVIGTHNMSDINVDNIIHMMTGMDLKERYPKLHIKPGREVLRASIFL